MGTGTAMAEFDTVRWYPYIMKSARRFKLPPWADHEDLGHETFIRVYRSLDGTPDAGRTAFVVRSIRFHMLDAAKSMRGESKTPPEFVEFDDKNAPVVTPEPTEAAIDVSRFLHCLSGRQREAIFGHYWLGESCSQIAANMGTTRQNAWYALSTGLAAMRKAVEQLS